MQWERIARAQAGVITRGQLEKSGLSEAATTGLCRRGQLERLRRGVFVAAAAPVSYEAALWAAVLGTGGTLGFGTGAHLWGYTEQAGREIDVIVGLDRGHRPVAGLRLHRVQLAPDSRQVRHGLPVTSRTCTLLDHLGRLRPDDALSLADRAFSRSWLTRRDLELRLRRHPGRSGNALLGKILHITADGAAARSERLLHAILRGAGIDGWVANHDVWVDGDLVAVIDVAFPEFCVAIEVDGMAFHVDPERFQRDRTRQNVLTNLGWSVLRFTWADLVDRPAQTASVILDRCVQPRDTMTQNRRWARRS